MKIGNHFEFKFPHQYAKIKSDEKYTHLIMRERFVFYTQSILFNKTVRAAIKFYRPRRTRRCSMYSEHR